MRKSNNNKDSWEFLYSSDNCIEKLPWLQDSFIDKFKEIIINLPIKEGSLIDVGCGFGMQSYLMSSLLSFDVIGIDISQRCIDYCNNNYKVLTPNLNFVLSDIKEFKTTRQYDVVLSHLLLQHIEPSDVETVCNKLISLLDDNGYMLLSWLKQDVIYPNKRPSFFGKHYVYYHKMDFVLSYFRRFNVIYKTTTSIEFLTKTYIFYTVILKKD